MNRLNLVVIFMPLVLLLSACSSYEGDPRPTHPTGYFGEGHDVRTGLQINNVLNALPDDQESVIFNLSHRITLSRPIVIPSGVNATFRCQNDLVTRPRAAHDQHNPLTFSGSGCSLMTDMQSVSAGGLHFTLHPNSTLNLYRISLQYYGRNQLDIGGGINKVNPQNEPIFINMFGGNLMSLLHTGDTRLNVITNNHITNLHNVELYKTPIQQLASTGVVNITNSDNQ